MYAGALRGQRRESDSMEMEVEAVVNHNILSAGNSSSSSAGPVSTTKQWPFYLPLLPFYFKVFILCV